LVNWNGTQTIFRYTPSPMPLDPHAIRRHFPLLGQTIDGQPVVYLDNAATTQKPLAVLDAMDRFYRTDNANAHRGMHVLAERSTVAYEGARKTIAIFIGAKRPEEIVFTRNCTEAINLVAKSWGKTFLKKGDVVVLTVLEHHSNIVPWLQLKEEIGIELAWIELDDRGQVRMDDLKKILQKNTVRLVAISGQSNVLGTRIPLEEIIPLAHANNALVFIDGAQLIAHEKIDVSALDADFFAFSGHKVYGPTGIGVLWGKQKLLSSMPPFLGGGMMIHDVEQDRFTPAEIPARFEAGTQPLAEAVGLAAAIDWLSEFSWKDIQAHESALLKQAHASLQTIPGVRILGSKDPADMHGCISFVIDGIHAHDLTEILGRKGICLRAGHHCTQPLHKHLGITASTRLSVGIYNTLEEILTVPPAIAEAVARLS